MLEKTLAEVESFRKLGQDWVVGAKNIGPGAIEAAKAVAEFLEKSGILGEFAFFPDPDGGIGIVRRARGTPTIDIMVEDGRIYGVKFPRAGEYDMLDEEDFSERTKFAIPEKLHKWATEKKV